MDGDPVEVRAARDASEVEAAKRLRLRVFTEEQGIPTEVEIDGLDPGATHIVAVRHGKVIGTCRLRFPRGRCKLERMAIDPGHRGAGVGSLLVGGAEREAARQGAHEMVMHAQRQVEGFYAGCGYSVEGDPFLEEGIPHVLMRKPLVPADRIGT